MRVHVHKLGYLTVGKRGHAQLTWWRHRGSWMAFQHVKSGLSVERWHRWWILNPGQNLWQAHLIN
jgi:hypothetical protein